MDQINPFTNAPINPPTPPQQNAPVPPPTAEPPKPGTTKPETPKNEKSEFDIKHIVKVVVMVGIGIVIAYFAFKSIQSMLTPPAPAPSKTPKKASSYKAPAPQKTTRGKKGEELSLSETFAAAKKAPKPPAKQQTEPFVINGVFLSEGGGEASAIINNKVVTVGDTVDGAMVKSINEDGVELMQNDEVIKLRYR